MTLAQHQAAAAAQAARHISTLTDEELNINFVYISAGAGVDDQLTAMLDEALTGAPPTRHVVILIERTDVRAADLSLGSLLSTAQESRTESERLEVLGR